MRSRSCCPGEDAEPVRDEIDPAVRFIPYRKPRLRDTRRQVRTCSALVRRIRDADPDVVHLQQGLDERRELQGWLLVRDPRRPLNKLFPEQRVKASDVVREVVDQFPAKTRVEVLRLSPGPAGPRRATPQATAAVGMYGRARLASPVPANRCASGP